MNLYVCGFFGWCYYPLVKYTKSLEAHFVFFQEEKERWNEIKKMKKENIKR